MLLASFAVFLSFLPFIHVECRCSLETFNYQNCMKRHYGADLFRLDKQPTIEENDFKLSLQQCFINFGCSTPYTAKDRPTSKQRISTHLARNESGRIIKEFEIDLDEIKNSHDIIAKCGQKVIKRHFRPFISGCVRESLHYPNKYQVPMIHMEILKTTDLEGPITVTADTIEKQYKILKFVRELTAYLLRKSSNPKYCRSSSQQKRSRKCIERQLINAETKLDLSPLKTAQQHINRFCNAQKNCERSFSARGRCKKSFRAQVEHTLVNCISVENMLRIYKQSLPEYFQCLRNSGLGDLRMVDYLQPSFGIVHPSRLDETMKDHLKVNLISLLKSYRSFNASNEKRRSVDSCSSNLQIFKQNEPQQIWDHFKIGDSFSPVLISLPKGALNRQQNLQIKRRPKRQSSEACNLIGDVKYLLKGLSDACGSTTTNNAECFANLDSSSQLDQMDEQTLLTLLDGGFHQVFGFHIPMNILVRALNRPFQVMLRFLLSHLPEYTRLNEWAHD